MLPVDVIFVKLRFANVASPSTFRFVSICILPARSMFPPTYKFSLIPVPPVTINVPVVVLVLPVPVVTVNGPTIPNESAIAVAPVSASIVNTSVAAVLVIVKSAALPLSVTAPVDATVNKSFVLKPPSSSTSADAVIVVRVVLPVTFNVVSRSTADDTSNVPVIVVLPAPSVLARTTASATSNVP